MSSGKKNTDNPSSSTSSRGTEQMFKVKNWNAEGLWSWDAEAENCVLCRNPTMDLCIECKADKSSKEKNCVLAWGKCNHVFHLHCILRWLKRRPVCPLDNVKWEFQKYGI